MDGNINMREKTGEAVWGEQTDSVQILKEKRPCVASQGRFCLAGKSILRQCEDELAAFNRRDGDGLGIAGVTCRGH